MKYPVQRFFIFTERNLISKEIKEPGRAMFFSGPKSILDAYVDGKITEGAQQHLMEELSVQYDVPALARPDKPKDVLIFDLKSYAEKVSNIVDYTDQLAEQYDKPFRIKDMLKWYVFKAITDTKFESKFIKQEDQLSLVDIKNIESENPNGISIISTSEIYDYLKDNISNIVEQFKASKLKTLDIYLMIKKPIEEAEGMIAKSSTQFTFEEGRRVMNLFTYPSTDVSITVGEV